MAPKKWNQKPCPTCGKQRKTVNPLWLKWRREKAGMTQEAVADWLAVARPSVTQFEAGVRPCPERVLAFYERHL